ncbi:DUF4199 domain-containing protein [Sphingomonas sp. BT-65]|uniref:DUF4199 domain-containing protein n=1 Tax=Sphingomonas sp. BT-65 TaxID=2989821 RepID=UPI0022365A0B|nr:DUF4199 domain-containing protein [Sphingomonas sp. BT-65]MCW4460748.1 DUF4199 domain-containing protein [Sphingomonas sp. BT-65]
MQRLILIYGLIAGVVVSVPLFLMGTLMADNPPTGAAGMAIGYLTMLIALSAVFVAIKRRRDHDLGGAIRFWPAFGLGVAISVVAALLYVLTWEAVLAINGGDFIADMSAKMLEQKRAAGASASELAAFRAQMDQMRELYANPILRMLITLTEILPVGLLVSLVSAALLRNPRFMPLRTETRDTAPESRS